METSIEGNDFIFDCFHLLYYKWHKTNLHCGGLYIDSPDWIKNKKATKNPIDKKDNKCFQYAVTAALSHEEVEQSSERIKKTKAFIYKYNWEAINFPSENLRKMI